MMMRPENRDWRVSPRIVRADRETTITLRPLFAHCPLVDGQTYTLRHVPVEAFAPMSGKTQGEECTAVARDGELRVTRLFEAEQEHVLLLELTDARDRKREWDFRIYSLEEDLFARLPWKGDLHMHSASSDGKQAPAFVPAAARMSGLDFMALTDHRAHAPSLEAISAYAGVPVDLAMFPGEEVHPPDVVTHIVNFGGSFSVNALFKEPRYRSEVGELITRLGPLPQGVNPLQYASCVWCFDRIRQGGGLAIFCHPYWFTGKRYEPDGALTSYMLEQQPFDALEVLGGFYRHEAQSNNLQIARYHEERAKGRKIPAIGVSDAHDYEDGQLHGWYATMVFSPTNSLPDLTSSIRELWSVALESLPGEVPRAHGPFRLVKYALYLMREIMPAHDELCAVEGRLMLAHVSGDLGAAFLLERMRGQVARYMTGMRGE